MNTTGGTCLSTTGGRRDSKAEEDRNCPHAEGGQRRTNPPMSEQKKSGEYNSPERNKHNSRHKMPGKMDGGKGTEGNVRRENHLTGGTKGRKSGQSDCHGKEERKTRIQSAGINIPK